MKPLQHLIHEPKNGSVVGNLGMVGFRAACHRGRRQPPDQPASHRHTGRGVRAHGIGHSANGAHRSDPDVSDNAAIRRGRDRRLPRLRPALGGRMTSEPLLARRLLEAVGDPEAPRTVADEAAAELPEVSVRLGVPPSRALPIETFEGMRADDLSPAAWLYLLEYRNAEEPEIPADVLEALFLEYSNAAVRFRLVRGALGQPRTRARYTAALEKQVEPENIATRPESWPKQRLDALHARRGRGIDREASIETSVPRRTPSRTTAAGGGESRWELP